MDDELKQLLVVGRELYERHEYERAEQVLRQILVVSDRFADVHNMLAIILHERGELAGAEWHFERAVELNPNYTEALLNLSVTYNDLGKYEAAQEVYARIRRGDGQRGVLDPYARGKIANMHADLAQAYDDAGCKQEAITELKRAVELCPTFADLQLRLGSLYRDIGNLAQARQHYEAACEANPNFATARVLLGVALISLGNVDEAIEQWREALVIEPENKSAQMYLRIHSEKQDAMDIKEESGELVAEPDRQDTLDDLDLNVEQPQSSPDGA